MLVAASASEDKGRANPGVCTAECAIFGHFPVLFVLKCEGVYDVSATVSSYAHCCSVCLGVC